MRINSIQNQAFCSAPAKAQKTGEVFTAGRIDEAKLSRLLNPSPCTLSFGKGVKGKNPVGVAFPIAEVPPFWKIGGVATVGNDYLTDFANWLRQAAENAGIDEANRTKLKKALQTEGAQVDVFVPAYNGDLLSQYNPADGGTTAVIREMELNINGQKQKTPVYISDAIWREKGYAYKPDKLIADLEKALVNPKGNGDFIKPGDYAILEKVTDADIDWGLNNKINTALYKVKNHPGINGANNALNANSNALGKAEVNMYFIHTPQVSLMRKPYADGSYSSSPKSLATEIKKSIDSGSDLKAMSQDSRIAALKRGLVPGENMAYAQFSKAFTELFAKADINDQTIICSDSQTALIPEYINIKMQNEGENCFYKDVRKTGVGHNIGRGSYVGPASSKDLALSLMSQEQLSKVLNDPFYLSAKLLGREEDYFKQFVTGFLDDDGNIATAIGLIKGTDRFDVVSNGYFEGTLDNPEVTSLRGAILRRSGFKGNPLDPANAANLKTWIENVKKDGNSYVGGIINGFSDPSFDPSKPLSAFKYYGNDVVITPDVKMIQEIGSAEDVKKVIADTIKQFTHQSDETKIQEVATKAEALVRQISINPDNRNTDIIDFIKKTIKDNAPEANDIDVNEAAINTSDKIITKSTVEKKGITAKAFSAFEDFRDKAKFNLESEADANGVRGLNSAYESLLETKRENKLSLLQRLGRYNIGTDENPKYLFATDVNPNYVAGFPNKNPKITGYIDEKFIKQLEEKIQNPNKSDIKDVNVLVSWGRGDFQKAHENTINAFINYATKPGAGENSVLVLGGSCEGNKEAEAAVAKAMNRAKDMGLEGRIVFVDGFAPNKPFGSAGDFMVLASRFAPCELTDVEALRYYATTIVDDTQGLRQKEFDGKHPRPHAYKTTNEYFMPPEKIKTILDSIIETDTANVDDGSTAMQIKKFKHSADLTDAEKAALEKAFPDSCGPVAGSDKYNHKFGIFDKLADDARTIYNKQKSEIMATRPEAKVNVDAYTIFKDSSEFKNLINKFRDTVQCDELAVAMENAVTDKQDNVKAAMIRFKNQVNLDVSWMNNNALNPDNNPSSILYVKRHVLGEASKIQPILDVSSLPETIDGEYAKNIISGNFGGTKGATGINFDSAALDNLNNTMQNISETQRGMLDAMKNNSSNHKVSKKSLGDVISNAANSRVLAVLGGAAAIAGLIAFVDHRDKVKALNMATDIQNDSVAPGQTQSGNEPATQPINSANNVVPVQTRPLVSHGVSSDNKFKSYFA